MDKTSRNASVPSKHRRTHELLESQWAGPDGVYWFDDIGAWTNVDERRHSDAESLIELAAIKWLMSREWAIGRYIDGRPCLFRSGLIDCVADTLIDALLAAVERECGEVGDA